MAILPDCITWSIGLALKNLYWRKNSMQRQNLFQINFSRTWKWNSPSFKKLPCLEHRVYNSMPWKICRFWHRVKCCRKSGHEQTHIILVLKMSSVGDIFNSPLSTNIFLLYELLRAELLEKWVDHFSGAKPIIRFVDLLKCIYWPILIPDSSNKVILIITFLKLK